MVAEEDDDDGVPPPGAKGRPAGMKAAVFDRDCGFHVVKSARDNCFLVGDGVRFRVERTTVDAEATAASADADADHSRAGCIGDGVTERPSDALSTIKSCD